VIRAGFAWLGGTVLALAAIIATELSSGPAARPVAGIVVPVAPMGAASGEPTTGLEQRWVAAILGRPLFDPSRRPPAEANQAPNALRLSGTVVGPGGPQAIFEPEGGGRAVIVREGERVGGAIVRSIVPGKVFVLDAGELHLLEPSFTSSASSLLADPQSPPPPANPIAQLREAK
jgi:hypothetical protein